MKKVTVILMVFLMVLTLSACANAPKEEEQKEEPAREPVNVPEDLCGRYHDEIAGRAALTISEDKATLDWSSSASEKAHFDMKLDYEEAENRINAYEIKLTNTVFESDTKSTVTEVYTGGTGTFRIEDGKLIYHDDQTEEGEDVVFVRDDETAEIIGMANPWTYSGDLQEAITGSSIEFDPPVSVPEGFELVKYGYNINGIIEAIYESADRKMSVRKSDIYEGLELAGDYNTYSKNWELSLKGLSVNAYGDGDTINLALFGNDSAHYSISVTDKEYKVTEGNGITADELNSLVNGMQ